MEALKFERNFNNKLFCPFFTDIVKYDKLIHVVGQEIVIQTRIDNYCYSLGSAKIAMFNIFHLDLLPEITAHLNAEMNREQLSAYLIKKYSIVPADVKNTAFALILLCWSSINFRVSFNIADKYLLNNTEAQIFPIH